MTNVRSFFNVSSVATVLMTFYMGTAIFNLYRLMFPLSFTDLSTVKEFIHPLWKPQEPLYLRVYLSTRSAFSMDFLTAGYEDKSDREIVVDTEPVRDVELLWDEKVNAAAFSKSFLLTTADFGDGDTSTDASYQFAAAWLDAAERSAIEQSQGGVLSVVSAAGQGIESTSILLSFYQSLVKQMRAASVALSLSPKPEHIDNTPPGLLDRTTIRLSPSSPIWSSLQSNSTVFVHVFVLRSQFSYQWPPKSVQHAETAFVNANQARGLLTGQVNLVKFDLPHHISKPGRVLYHDLVYLWRRYVLGYSQERPPWDFEYSKPEAFATYKHAQTMKSQKSGYPYWKPQVAIKYVADTVDYPSDLLYRSGMPVVQVKRSQEHPSGYSFIPAIHVDEIGLTSDKYIPINETVTSLPLRISFDRSDMEHLAAATTGTAGGISPARWRLLTHLSDSLESQKQLGIEQSDIDDLRRLIADTNVTLLLITLLASSLHLLFEFLTFKNEVSFWNSNTDLTGLSVRSLFLDMIGQTIILIFLIERDSSLLITVPNAIGCLIALWKCKRAAGLTFVRVGKAGKSARFWNVLPRLVGYELRATRLDKIHDKSGDDPSLSNRDRLAALTLEADRVATRTLGVFLLPLVIGYAMYSFFREEHSGWFSWLITSASSAVYALGFALMCPQLFLNWKLKSVAHLPWRVLVYKSLNTFIDDLFSFIIRMPTMARISCFRDDIVFFVYLYQRWLYPVDLSRPVEGGGDMRETSDGNADSKVKKKKKE